MYIRCQHGGLCHEPGGARFCARQFGLPVRIFRPFNTYGPGQSSLFLIPEIIQKDMDPSVTVVEVMDLQPKRDYIYIDDLVEAFLLSMDGPKSIYNLGSGYSKSVEEIILLVMELTGIRKEYRSKAVTRPNEIFDLYADISKAARELKWTPATSFEDGILRCIQAYQQQ